MSARAADPTRRRYELRDATGQIVAVHVREDGPEGGKRFTWQRPDERPGLGGIATADLPLYGIERLDGLASQVILVEGEKAAEALWSAGVAAVATVTGAASAPGPMSLAELNGRDVVLWPDADPVGKRHMASIAERLRDVAASVAIVQPEEDTPPGWDAADAVAEGRDIGSILATAEPQPTQPGDGPTTGAVGPEAIVTRLSAVMPQSLDWLWPGYIPAGMLTILDGDPGLGKSLLALDLAARVTRGYPMPGDRDGVIHEPRGAVLLSAEDDLARTIRPRLDAAGAELDRVAVVALRERDGSTRDPVISAADLRAVEVAIREVDAVLLVVDPLVAYLPDEVNANRDHDVRRALALLAALGERTGAAVVAIRHLRKASADNPLYRGGGSIGIIGAARAGLLVARDPDDPSGARRVLAVTKSNLGPLPPSLAFRVEVAPDMAQPQVAWQGGSTHRAADLLAPTAGRGGQSALEEAADFLHELLTDGPVPVTEVYAEATAAGIARRTLDRAKNQLGVRSVRPDGFTGPWSWALSASYIANEGRTSPRTDDGDVRETMAEYGAEPTTADRVGRRAAGPAAASPPDENGLWGADGTVPGWRCSIDLGSGHLPALRTDGSVYCGTCHPMTAVLPVRQRPATTTEQAGTGREIAG